MDRHLKASAKWMLLVTVSLTLAGCVGTAANLMYMLQGLKIEAVYDGLKKSTVAIVVVSDASSYGPDTLTNIVGRAMSMRLSNNVTGITVIPQNVIENWKDTHGWDEVDFREIGAGIGADRVVAVEIGSYSIHEGTTMYKGRAMVTTTVYDMEANGDVVFTQGPAEYQFPRSHARPALSTSESRFEAVYLGMLVDNIARNFYDHEKVDAVAEDASNIGLD